MPKGRIPAAHAIPIGCLGGLLEENLVRPHHLVLDFAAKRRSYLNEGTTRQSPAGFFGWLLRSISVEIQKYDRSTRIFLSFFHGRPMEWKCHGFTHTQRG
jgi:hypothetical protein